MYILYSFKIILSLLVLVQEVLLTATYRNLLYYCRYSLSQNSTLIVTVDNKNHTFTGIIRKNINLLNRLLTCFLINYPIHGIRGYYLPPDVRYSNLQ